MYDRWRNFERGCNDNSDRLSDRSSRTDGQREYWCVVVEDGGAIDGIVTDREIALAVAEHEGDLSSVTVGDVMTLETVTLHENDESLKAANTMAESGVRRIPVVDDADTLVGLVSLDDVVSLTGEQLGDAATVIEKQSSSYEA